MGAGEPPKKAERFSEPPKFLPVAFVTAIIVGLYLIYTCLHIWPMLQIGVPSEHQDHDKWIRGIIAAVVFHYITLMLVICYVASILTSPGEIPDKEVDPYWEFVPQDKQQSARASDVGGPPNLQESKKSGERRHCKWCAKYKPDRCHHCRVCRTCVLKMDHHCPWIYNCVGFRNHKVFFLLLFYAVLDTHLIMWSMIESVKAAVDEPETPFLTLFLIFFGETLACFLGILVSAFWGFHVWLMMRAMTTIEFCEKSLKNGKKDGGHSTSAYDNGPCGNIKTVLGEQPFLWLFPVAPGAGDGLTFVGEHSRLSSKIMEPGRGGMRRVGHKKTVRNKPRRTPRGGESGEESAGAAVDGRGYRPAV